MVSILQWFWPKAYFKAALTLILIYMTDATHNLVLALNVVAMRIVKHIVSLSLVQYSTRTH